MPSFSIPCRIGGQGRIPHLAGIHVFHSSENSYIFTKDLNFQAIEAWKSGIGFKSDEDLDKSGNNVPGLPMSKVKILTT